MVKRLVIPTVFSHNKKEFIERLEKITALSKNIQIDFMDGKFVKDKSISVDDLPNLKEYNNNFEAHLMCYNPEKYLTKLKKNGFFKIIFHCEAVDDKKINDLIDQINYLGMRACIAINPDTKIDRILPHLNNSWGVLFMGHKPGVEHTKFVDSVYKKIELIRPANPKLIIEIDGGVDLSVANKLKKLNVNIIDTGSFVVNAKDPQKAYDQLEEAFI